MLFLCLFRVSVHASFLSLNCFDIIRSLSGFILLLCNRCKKVIIIEDSFFTSQSKSLIMVLSANLSECVSCVHIFHIDHYCVCVGTFCVWLQMCVCVCVR